MKKIALTQGKAAIVDDRDYDFLMQWKWCYWRNTPANSRTGYAVRTARVHGKQKTIRMHRVIVARRQRLGRKEVDHKDHNGLNNCNRNLRCTTRKQNSYNQQLRRTTSSGLKGVCWHKASNKWRAYITVNGQMIHLGVFRVKCDAARAYNKAAKHHHGKHSNVNKL